jgi:hypothetical protein
MLVLVLRLVTPEEKPEFCVCLDIELTLVGVCEVNLVGRTERLLWVEARLKGLCIFIVGL